MAKASVCSILWGFIGCSAWGYEFVLPVPSHHFNDYAHVVPTGTVVELNEKLEQFQGATSSELIVVVLPKMESDSPMLDYTERVAKSWGVGEYGRANSAVLFVFARERRACLQVGGGLGKALPVATASSVVETIIEPSLKKGDFDAGLRAGVAAILHEMETHTPPVARSKPIPRSVSETNAVSASPSAGGTTVVASLPPAAESKPPPSPAPVTTNAVANELPADKVAEVSSATNQSPPATLLPPAVETKPAPTAQPGTNVVKVAPVARPVEVSASPNRSGAGTVATSKDAFTAYDNAVIQKVQRRWNALLERFGSYEKSGKVMVRFQLLQDGSIQGLKITNGTGSKILGLICQKAVMESVPFPAFPANLQKLMNHKPRDVSMTFQY
jgi:uncharacterized membrane protein YgcG